MAIRKFKASMSLAHYAYDDKADRVISYKSGRAKNLTWSQAYSWYPKRVSMVTDQGYKVSYKRDEILGMLDAVEAEVASSFTGLDGIKPNFEYVLFSRRNKASQFFYANTSVAQALAMFAKRGEHIAPEDIRILNTVTNKVSSIKAKPVTTVTYTLD